VVCVCGEEVVDAVVDVSVVDVSVEALLEESAFDGRKESDEIVATVLEEDRSSDDEAIRRCSGTLVVAVAPSGAVAASKTGVIAREGNGNAPVDRERTGVLVAVIRDEEADTEEEEEE